MLSKLGDREDRLDPGLQVAGLGLGGWSWSECLFVRTKKYMRLAFLYGIGPPKGWC